MPVHAQAPVDVRLVYTQRPGAGCPPESDLHRRITARMGFDPVTPDAPYEIFIEIVRKKRDVASTIEIRNAEGQLRSSRTLWEPGATCNDLLDATAIMVALELDSLSMRREEEPAKPVAPAAVPECPVAPAPAPPPARPINAPATMLRLDAHLLAARGLSSAQAFGGSGAVELRFSAISVALEARAFLPSEAMSTQHRALDVSVAGGLFAPCFRAPPLFVCALGGAERVRAKAVDFRVDRGFWRGLAGLRAGGAWVLPGGVELEASAEALAPLTSKTITVRDTGDVWTTPAVTGVLGVGVSVPLGAVF